MLRAFVPGLIGVLLAASPASAVEWFTESVAGVITTTAFEGVNSVAITCKAGELSFAIGIRASAAAAPIAVGDAVYVRTTSDPAADGSTPSFTSRATADKSGNIWAYVLNAKDSGARIAAFTGARTELEFSLSTEPGGERYNTFRLPVAGASDALTEVLAACSGPIQEPASVLTPPSETPPPPANPEPVGLPPIGPGPLTDSLWHLVKESGARMVLYRRDADNNSLTFECTSRVLSVTLGLPTSRVHSSLADNPRANLVMGFGSEQREEGVSQVRQEDVAFYRLSGSRTADYLSRLAGQDSDGRVGLAIPGPSTEKPSDQVRNLYPISTGEITDQLAQVLSACGTATVTQVERNWSTDNWVEYSFDGYISADAEFVEDNGEFLRISFSCSDGVIGLDISIPARLADPAITSLGATVALRADFGLGSVPFGASNLGTDERVSIYLSPPDAMTAFNGAMSSKSRELTFDIVEARSGRTVLLLTTGVNGLAAALAPVNKACNRPPEPERQKGVWNYYVDSEDRPTAEIELEDGSLLSFFCSDGPTFLFSTPELFSDIADRDQIDVLFAIDPTRDGVANRYWVTDIDLHKHDTYASVGFRGSAVLNWARRAQSAGRIIEVGLSPSADAHEFNMYNSTSFPAKGSTAAIKQFRSVCK